jgi:hypothetical protein
VPGLSPDKMKATDERFATFAPVTNPGSEVPLVEFRPQDQKVKACITFNQELKPNDASYREAVRVEVDDKTVASGIESKGRELCLSGLRQARTTPSH